MKFEETLPGDGLSFAAVRAEHQARHGAAIAYLRRQIEPGTEYANEVARAVLSDAGLYYQLHELPEEFVGVVGESVAHRLIAEAEARRLLAQIRTLVEDILGGRFPARACSLYVLYAGGGLMARSGMFVFDHRDGQPGTLAHGAWQDDLPRVFKLRLHLDQGQAPPDGLPSSGIVLFLVPDHTDGSQCLLATIHRTPETRDLGHHPAPSGVMN